MILLSPAIKLRLSLKETRCGRCCQQLQQKKASVRVILTNERIKRFVQYDTVVVIIIAAYFSIVSNFITHSNQ